MNNDLLSSRSCIEGVSYQRILLTRGRCCIGVCSPKARMNHVDIISISVQQNYVERKNFGDVR